MYKHAVGQKHNDELLVRILFRIFSVIISVVTLNLMVSAQEIKQLVSGTVSDVDSNQPLSGAYVVCYANGSNIGSTTDSLGRFKLLVPIGRHSFLFQYMGYSSKQISDIQVGSGKAVFLNIALQEQVYQTEEIAVKAAARRWINPMATVSARTLRSQDASRYAAGYFDASRMVNNFAGVASGNSDDNNEIIIRGNSPRGLLWRLEGIEVPNPNHFSNGQGSSGGGYSSITTNVLSNFDFFTGAFPAEYGNAYSGVMDLNLRNGNAEKNEFSVSLSVLGAEASAEGPINQSNGSSYLINYRYADFSYLAQLGVLDKEDHGIVPNTSDYAFKTSFKTRHIGSFDVFAVGGSSEAGDLATSSLEDLKSGGDQDEFYERQTTAVAGIKHTIPLANNKTSLRSTLAFTYEFTSDRSRLIDTLLNKNITYYDFFEYPALRFATQVNHKFDVRNSIKLGIGFSQIWGDMFSLKLNSKNQFDTLMNTTAKGFYSNYFAQWKYLAGRFIEINTGLQIFHSGITHELLFEPRWGMLARLPWQQSLNFGLGLHSRLEPLSVYHYETKVSNTIRDERNIDLSMLKAFHWVFGYTKYFGSDWQVNLEGYFQNLWDVPIREVPQGQYSLINSLGGLPDVIMANNGKGKNKGVELTVEKSFSHNYYALATASIFDSKYLAPDGEWYNTYFNTNYVYNLLGGKEFPVGEQKQNTFGLKLRGNYRGGFRYTPVDVAASLKAKKLIYDIEQTYGKRLPDYSRIDFGLSFRINKKRNAWILLADIQNIFNTKNTLRRKFEYKNKQIIVYESKSIGMVPVLTIRAEF